MKCKSCGQSVENLCHYCNEAAIASAWVRRSEDYRIFVPLCIEHIDMSLADKEAIEQLKISITDEAAEILLNYVSRAHALQDMSITKLLEVAEDYTAELTIDDPVGILIDELTDRIQAAQSHGFDWDSYR